MNAKLLLFCIIITVMLNFSRGGSLFTNTVSANAFVRSNAPTLNYGGSGALSVSGGTATNSSGVANGIADTFIRFNANAMITNFNSLFGTNNWVINGAALRVTEAGNPNNGIFDRGKGAFQIFWVANDDWVQGTGTPMTPTMDGVVYTNEPVLLANTVSLGLFTNAAANSTNSYSLSLPVQLTGNLSAGGEVGLFLTAIDPQTGFTFNSQNFTVTNERPVLVISAVPQPAIVGISLSGTNVVIVATNGIQNGTYVVWSSTDISSPLNQWTPIVTNVLSTSGTFSITATNAVPADAPSQQFYLLQTQ